MTEDEGRALVLAEAVTWLRTPYHHQGRLRGVGTDCAMLVAEVYHNAMPDRVPAIDPGYYPPDWHMHRSAERYLEWVEKFAVRVDAPKPGDIVLYRWGRCLAHGGIVVAWPGRIIHALSARKKFEGVTYAEGDAGILAGREHRFYSLWPGVA